MNRFNRGTHPFASLVEDLVEHLRAQQEEQPEDEDLCSRCRHAKGKPEPAKEDPKPMNRNVARVIRCGGEAVQPGRYQITTDEPLVVISVADLDKFVSACGKVDKV